jgi:hypothetical protein
MLCTFSIKIDAVAVNVIRPTQSQMQSMCGTDLFKILLATHGQHLHTYYKHNEHRMNNKI